MKIYTIEEKNEELFLRTKSESVISLKELKSFKKEIKFLEKKFLENSNTVWIAAPQIWLLKRIIFIKQITKINEKKEIVSFKNYLMINPEIIEIDENKTIDYEWCLSVPKIEKKVERSKKIKILYYDEKMKKHFLYAENFNARIILHEIDHLNWILFIDY